MIIDNKYFKDYRSKLGFTNQNEVKNYFSGKDLIPSIDLEYIYSLNKRLESISKVINQVIHSGIRIDDIELFIQKNINEPFEKLKSNGILSQLNNQGRRPEQVYFSWMRGFVLSNLFLKSLGIIFKTDIKNILLIGDDDLNSIETFKRTPKADLQINSGEHGELRIEMQTGFKGINDIKQHKVLEAKRVKLDYGISTIAIHFDLYNGQAAFITLDEIEEDNLNWITRQQMEGQTVFNIDQNYFIWKLMEEPPIFENLDLNI